MQLFYIFVFVF